MEISKEKILFSELPVGSSFVHEWELSALKNSKERKFYLYWPRFPQEETGWKYQPKISLSDRLMGTIQVCTKMGTIEYRLDPICCWDNRRNKAKPFTKGRGVISPNGFVFQVKL